MPTGALLEVATPQPSLAEGVKIPHGNETLTFRTAKPEDKQAYIGLFRELFPHDEPSVQVLEKEFARLENPDRLSHSNIHTQLFLLEKEGVPVGFRWAKVRSQTVTPEGIRKGDGIAYVPYGGITTSEQNKGYYTHLMDASEEYFRQQGVSVVTAECENPLQLEHNQLDPEAQQVAWNRLRFFDKRGYKFIGTDYTFPNYWDAVGADRSWEQSSMNNYLLGFKVLSPDMHERVYTTGGDTLEQVGIHGITNTFARELYNKQMHLVLTDVAPSEKFDAWLQTLPAVQEFENEISRVGRQVPLFAVAQTGIPIGSLHTE